MSTVVSPVLIPASAPSPSSSRFSPQKPSRHEPNPHPYAIKTTSTGILSRSTTSAHSQSQYQYYVPASPSPSSKAPPSVFVYDDNLKGSGASRGRHRYSRSLTGGEDGSPRPLPLPLELDFSANSASNQGSKLKRRLRVKRADTLPSQFVGDDGSDLLTSEDGPKQWNTEKLIDYLILQLSESIYKGVSISEVVTFIRDNEITGRTFLRLDEGVLNAYGITSKYLKLFLLSCSRDLRQTVLHGRILPFHPSTVGPSTNRERRSDNRRVSRSANSSPTRSFPLYSPHIPTPPPDKPADHEDDQSYLSSSSTSSIADQDSSGQQPKRRGRRAGRVRGMVASFERSSSIDEHDDAAFQSNRRHGDEFSANDSTIKRPLPAPPPIEMPPYPYHTPQHTGSSTASSRPLPPPPNGGYILWPGSAPASTERHSPEIRQPEPIRPRATGVEAWLLGDEATETIGATVKRIPSASVAQATAEKTSMGDGGEEMAVEELLALQDGAVKSASLNAEQVDADATFREGEDFFFPERIGRGKGKAMSFGKEKTQGQTESLGRIGVGDLFFGHEPSEVEEVSAPKEGKIEVNAQPERTFASAAVQTDTDETTPSAEAQADREEEYMRLQDELQSTRAMADQFRQRLAEVEKKMEDIERENRPVSPRPPAPPLDSLSSAMTKFRSLANIVLSSTPAPIRAHLDAICQLVFPAVSDSRTSTQLAQPSVARTMLLFSLGAVCFLVMKMRGVVGRAFAVAGVGAAAVVGLGLSRQGGVGRGRR